jgi:hypothetical protein
VPAMLVHALTARCPNDHPVRQPSTTR